MERHITARIAGIAYLLNIATIFVAILCFRGTVVAGDAAATARNVLAHQTAIRTGFAFELISTTCSLVVAALLFDLFRPINRGLSLLAAFFRMTACAVAAIGYVFQIAPLQILTGNQSSSIAPHDLQALALLFYSVHVPLTSISIVFFGFHFLVLGPLVIRSTFLPRIVGALMVIAGLGALIFLAPTIAKSLFPYFAAPALLAEISLAISLLAVRAE